MKKLIFAFIFLIAGTIATSAQDNNPVPNAKFKEVSHAFGNIPQGVPATTVFTYKNTGNTPLVIETATASCGCTTPEYPKTPVLAGKTGEIKVTYNAVATGNFTKMVTVKFANNQKPVLLKIEGNVLEKKTTASN